MTHALRLPALLVAVLMIGAGAAGASPNDSGTAAPGGWTPYQGPASFSFGEPGDGGLRDTCECLDLVLVIDDTGSMSGAISNVQSGMIDILRLADSVCTNVQAALVTFKDYVEVDVPLTFDLAQVTAGVNALVATGGDEEPEASDEALREVFTSTVCDLVGDFDPNAFREGCCKVTILVTDANPGGCDDLYESGVDDVNAHLRALEAQSLGVNIGALFVPTFGDPNGTITPVMVDYATTTGGVFGQTAANGSGTADAIQQVILDCVGMANTELCCLPNGDCVEVLAGNCADLGGQIVDDCETCFPTPAEESTWGKIKSTFRNDR